MSLLWWILPLLLILPFLWCLRVLVTYRTLNGIRLGATSIVPIETEQFPRHIREALERHLKLLEQLGFHYRQVWLQRPENQPEFDVYEVEFARADGGIRAIFRPNPHATKSGELACRFCSTLSDGFELVSTHVETEDILPRSRAIIPVVMPDASLEDVFTAHQAKLAEFAKAGALVVPLSAVAARERFQLITDDEFNAAVQSGLLCRQRNGRYAIHSGKGLTKAIELVRAYARRTKAENARARFRLVTPISPESQSQFDYEHFRQMRALRRAGFSLKIKTAIALVSMAAFAAALSFSMGWEAGLTVVLAILFHEAGHLVAMWCFGCRDTQLVFIPFFGGAAVAADDVVLKPWQSVVVSLAGPLPGIFVGLALFFWSSFDLNASALLVPSLIVVGLNAINLFPILPLDGGQILDAAVANRFPRARLLFLFLSAMGMIGFSLLGGGGTMMLIAGVLAILRLGTEKKLADLEVEVRNDAESMDEPVVIPHLFASMREGAWAKTPLPQRMQLVSGLWSRLRRPLPGVGTAAFAIAMFLSPVWLALPLTIFALKTSTEHRVEVAKQRAAATNVLPDVEETRSVSLEDNAAAILAGVNLHSALAQGWEEDLDESEEAAASEEQAGPPREEPARAPVSAEALVLLRQAAAKPAYAAVDEEHAVARSRNLRALELLARGAREAAAGGNSASACDLLIAAFDLEQKFRREPRDWHWGEHERAMLDLVDAVKVVTAAQTDRPESAVRIAEYLNVEAEFAYAVAQLPGDALRVLDQLKTTLHEGSEEDAGWFDRGIQLFSDHVQAAAFAAAVDRSVALKEALERARKGDWPAKTAAEIKAASDMRSSHVADQTGRLAEFLAAIRLAKASLAPSSQVAGTDQTNPALRKL